MILDLLVAWLPGDVGEEGVGVPAHVDAFQRQARRETVGAFYGKERFTGCPIILVHFIVITGISDKGDNCYVVGALTSFEGV